MHCLSPARSSATPTSWSANSIRSRLAIFRFRPNELTKNGLIRTCGSRLDWVKCVDRAAALSTVVPLSAPDMATIVGVDAGGNSRSVRLRNGGGGGEQRSTSNDGPGTGHLRRGEVRVDVYYSCAMRFPLHCMLVRPKQVLITFRT